MKCENYKQMITDMLAGELPEKEKSDLEKHLSSCEACSKEMKEQSECWNLIGSALTSEAMDTSIGEERHEEIEKASRDKVVPFTDLVRKFVWLELAACLVLCAAIAFIILPSLREYSSGLKKEKESLPSAPPSSAAVGGENMKEEYDRKSDVLKDASPRELRKDGAAVADKLNAFSEKGKFAEQTELPLPEEEVAPMKPAAPAIPKSEPTAALTQPPAPAMSKMSVAAQEAPVAGKAAARGGSAKAYKAEGISKAPLIEKKKSLEALDVDVAPSPELRKEAQQIADDINVNIGKDQAPAPGIMQKKIASADGMVNEIQEKNADEQAANRQVMQGFSGQNMMVTTASRTYQLDFKSIGVTNEKTFREYLKRNGAKFADSAKIVLDIEKGTVTISTPSNMIADADTLLIKVAKAKIRPSAAPNAEIESKVDASKMSK